MNYINKSIIDKNPGAEFIADIGLSTLTYFSLPVLKALQEIKGLGFRAVEILCEWPHCWPPGMSKDEVRALASYTAANKLKVGIHAPISDINPVSPNPGVRRETRKQLKSTVDFAAELGAEVMVFHIGHKSPFGILESSRLMEYAVETLGQLIPYAKSRGVKMCLENNPKVEKTFGQTIEECLQYVTSLPGIGLACDVGHANTIGPDYPRQFISKCGELLKVIHLNDNRGVRDEHLAMGAGTVDYTKVIGELLKGGFRGALTIEVKTVADAIISHKKVLSLINENFNGKMGETNWLEQSKIRSQPGK